MRGSTSVIELLKWSSSFGRVLRDLVAQLLMMSLTWVQRCSLSLTLPVARWYSLGDGVCCLTWDVMFSKAFFVAILLKLNENTSVALFLPLLAGIFDLSENISISMMMSFNSFSEIPESQILYASLFNQCKWSLCLCVLIFIFYRLILITLKRGV